MKQNEEQAYRFLFRAPGEGTVQVKRDTKPGEAEALARRMAKRVAKKLRAAEVVCVWMGPEDVPVPSEIIREIRRERVT